MTAGLVRRLERAESEVSARAWARYRERVRHAELLHERFLVQDREAARLWDELRDRVEQSTLAPPPNFLAGWPDDERAAAWCVLRDPTARGLYAEIRRRWAATMVEPWPWEGDDVWWQPA